MESNKKLLNEMFKDYNLHYIYKLMNDFIKVFEIYFEKYEYKAYNNSELQLNDFISMLEEILPEQNLDYNVRGHIDNGSLLLIKSNQQEGVFFPAKKKIIVYSDNLSMVPIANHEISHYIDYLNYCSNQKAIYIFTETLAYATEFLCILLLVKNNKKYRVELFAYLDNLLYSLLILIKKIFPLINMAIMQKENYNNYNEIINDKSSLLNKYLLELQKDTINIEKLISYIIAPNLAINLLQQNLVNEFRIFLKTNNITNCKNFFDFSNIDNIYNFAEGIQRFKHK